MNYHTKYNKYYSTKEHKEWRDKIRARDKVCQDCLARGVITQGVEAHHIVPLDKQFSKRHNLANGVLLCKDCHNQRHEKRKSSLVDFFNPPPI